MKGKRIGSTMNCIRKKDLIMLKALPVIGKCNWLIE